MGPVNPFAGVAVSVKAAGWPLVTMRDAAELPLIVSVKDAGCGVVPLPAPVPARATVSGSCVTLLASERVPICAPSVVGVKVTLSVHCAPAARVAPEAGQVPLLTAKGALVVREPKVMGEAPVLVAVTVSWLLWLRLTEPKSI